MSTGNKKKKTRAGGSNGGKVSAKMQGIRRQRAKRARDKRRAPKDVETSAAPAMSDLAQQVYAELFKD